MGSCFAQRADRSAAAGGHLRANWMKMLWVLLLGHGLISRVVLVDLLLRHR